MTLNIVKIYPTSKSTIDKINTNKNFINVINALKIMRYEIPKGSKCKTTFKQAALIVGISENQIDKFNPNSKNYNPFANFADIASYDVIIEEAELQQSKAELQYQLKRKQKLLKEIEAIDNNTNAQGIRLLQLKKEIERSKKQIFELK